MIGFSVGAWWLMLPRRVYSGRKRTEERKGQEREKGVEGNRWSRTGTISIGMTGWNGHGHGHGTWMPAPGIWNHPFPVPVFAVPDGSRSEQPHQDGSLPRRRCNVPRSHFSAEVRVRLAKLN